MARSTTPTTVLAGRYALEQRLGRGATGMVWRAHDALLRRTVAVTLVHPRLADDPAFVDALEGQARGAAALSAPGTARLLDTGREDGLPFLVHAFVPGPSARELGARPADRAARIARSMAFALAELHDRGILHLSLDADDVHVANDDAAVLTGLVIGPALAASRPADAAELLGPDRVAPEQLAGATADERTDVYLAGAVLFEMLTGEPPRGRRSPRSVASHVPRPLDRVVARALDPDPERRFPSARAFGDALERTGDEHVVVVPETSRGPGLFAWVGVPLVIAGVAAGLIALGLWFGQLEVGGPLGVRPARERPTASRPIPVPVRPELVTAVDPFGDGDELSANAPLAADGDHATAWRSEDYFDGELGKPGIGLLLDLGRRTRVLGLRLWTPHPGFTFGVAIGDDPGDLVGGVQEVTAAPVTHVLFEGSGRFVMIWITSVVPVDDGDRAEVSELEIVTTGSHPEDAGG